MNVLVIGSTTLERRFVVATLDRCWATWGAFAVTTGPGAKLEEWVSHWAERKGTTWRPLAEIRDPFPERWADAAVVFDAAHSPRTRMLVRQFKRWGKPIHEYGAKETRHG